MCVTHFQSRTNQNAKLQNTIFCKQIGMSLATAFYAKNKG